VRVSWRLRSAIDGCQHDHRCESDARAYLVEACNFLWQAHQGFEYAHTKHNSERGTVGDHGWEGNNSRPPSKARTTTPSANSQNPKTFCSPRFVPRGRRRGQRYFARQHSNKPRRVRIASNTFCTREDQATGARNRGVFSSPQAAGLVPSTGTSQTFLTGQQILSPRQSLSFSQTARSVESGRGRSQTTWTGFE